MMISGLVKASCVDYPGKLAAVIFTQGCNLRCSFCHNAGLLPATNPWSRHYDPEDVLGWLETRRGLLDGVVISGGEPTLRPGLIPFARKLKNRGFCLKLDTNGTRPMVVEAMLAENLLDYVAMDLKAPLARYPEICGVEDLDLEAIKHTVRLIKDSGILHQFRTTLAPTLSSEDVKAIQVDFAVLQTHLVQEYRPPLSPVGAEKVAVAGVVSA
jgi:pyruvate formate lyase activating enzyme